jgi:hypothetical protein
MTGELAVEPDFGVRFLTDRKKRAFTSTQEETGGKKTRIVGNKALEGRDDSPRADEDGNENVGSTVTRQPVFSISLVCRCDAWLKLTES